LSVILLRDPEMPELLEKLEKLVVDINGEERKGKRQERMLQNRACGERVIIETPLIKQNIEHVENQK